MAWLNYIGERGLAEMLRGVSDVKESLARIREFKALKSRQRKKTRYYNK